MFGVEKEGNGPVVLANAEEGVGVGTAVEEGVVGFEEDTVDRVGGKVGTVATMATHVLDDRVHPQCLLRVLLQHEGREGVDDLQH